MVHRTKEGGKSGFGNIQTIRWDRDVSKETERRMVATYRCSSLLTHRSGGCPRGLAKPTDLEAPEVSDLQTE